MGITEVGMQRNRLTRSAADCRAVCALVSQCTTDRRVSQDKGKCCLQSQSKSNGGTTIDTREHAASASERTYQRTMNTIIGKNSHQSLIRYVIVVPLMHQVQSLMSTRCRDLHHSKPQTPQPCTLSHLWPSYNSCAPPSFRVLFFRAATDMNLKFSKR
jgi:hypothetical protein